MRKVISILGMAMMMLSVLAPPVNNDTQPDIIEA
jgi:hypothetical protein